MSLTKTWSPFFQPRMRMQGRRLHQSGSVAQISPQAGEVVRADVEDGDASHVVTLAEEGENMRAHCTCDQYASGQYCPHIWATLLDVQDNGPKHEEEAALAEEQPSMPKARKREGRRSHRATREPEWIGRLTLLRPPNMALEDAAPPTLPTQRMVAYVVDAEMCARASSLVISLQQRTAHKSGWSKFKLLKVSEQNVGQLSDPIDRELCSLLLGAAPVFDDQQHAGFSRNRTFAQFRVPAAAQQSLLRRMIATGRGYVQEEYEEPRAIQWDDHEQPWVLWATGREGVDELAIDVELRRGEERREIEDPVVILGGAEGMVIFRDGVAASFDDREAFRWVTQFRDDLRMKGDASPIRVPADDIDRFLDRLYMLPQLPELELPVGVGRHEVRAEPVPALELSSPRGASTATKGFITANVWFEYHGHRVRPTHPGRYVPVAHDAVVNETTEADSASGDVEMDEQMSSDGGAPHVVTVTAESVAEHAPLIRRNRRAEEQAMTMLAPLGFRPGANGDGLVIASKGMPAAVRELIAGGWKVAVDAKALRSARGTSLRVSSGIDWFELQGGFKYQTDDGEQVVPLPDILKAVRSGTNMVTLADGSQGMLPSEWLAEHGLLTAVGQLRDDHLRFQGSQAALLDSLLDEDEAIETDDAFQKAREKITQFRKIEPAEAADTFHGTLRPYQKEGLGWLRFLRWFGMGGILADDMGLGKTIQLLALLDQLYSDPDRHSRKNGDTPHLPSIVVAPRSVVYNWIDEAERFTPRLKVLSYNGTERDQLRDNFDKVDLIVTSYGLLRRDVTELLDHDFDTVILDEAQAIKNPQSQGAKAARTMRARHRLALTGTPVENHLGDLWSIFEFLNPGMLGAAAQFNEMIKAGVEDTRSVESAQQAGKALRPFILRRTKQEVLQDLPEKTEQTLVCEMEPAQRKIYDDLRNHYRGTLLTQIDASGRSVSGNAMVVLEALLRLRQAACHPGLIDGSKSNEPSAKLDTLLEQLKELHEEGHKALVFSQFTSLLSIVKQHIEKRKWDYEYLDGQTRDRKSCVERFQNDDDCKLFLISLKAGGVGLNLTAAEYVFILDPWWNPAVEQQAIDRAHRIGQTRHVFAYRLICENTVEQRIAQLQAKKKQLADAIIGGEGGILKSLTRDDLEQLLS